MGKYNFNLNTCQSNLLKHAIVMKKGAGISMDDLAGCSLVQLSGAMWLIPQRGKPTYIIKGLSTDYKNKNLVYEDGSPLNMENWERMEISRN